MGCVPIFKLSPISLDESLLDTIQWVIVGGESGPLARLGMKYLYSYYLDRRLNRVVRLKTIA